MATSAIVSATADAWSVSVVMRVNTTEANPRGPNHPTNTTVSRRRPTPARATATGAILMRVRLRIANPIAASDIGPVNVEPTNKAPKTNQTKKDAYIDNVSVNSVAR